jgi:hypothetical protein
VLQVTDAAEAGEAGIGGEILTLLAQWALDTLQCRTPTPLRAMSDALLDQGEDWTERLQAAVE